MAKKANLERQADLKRDTEKLLKLANELKESVDKTNEGMLSVDVVKKAEEIEKLAHSVKDKMKGSATERNPTRDQKNPCDACPPTNPREPSTTSRCHPRREQSRSAGHRQTAC